MHLPLAKAKVLIVGGPGVDARLALMHCFSDAFDLSALDSLPALRDKFLAVGEWFKKEMKEVFHEVVKKEVAF